jgi:hypothetical protein
MTAALSAAPYAPRFLPPAGAVRKPPPTADQKSAAQTASFRAMFVGAAMLAARRGWQQEVADIRQIVVPLGVDGVRFDIALAMIALERSDPKACLAILEDKVFVKQESDELARAVQVVAWRQLGAPGWQSQANFLLATSSDALVRSLVV